MAMDKKTQIKEENALLKLQQDTANEYNLSLERTAQLQERITDKIERAKKAGKDLKTVYDDILGSMDEMTARTSEMEKREAKRIKLANQYKNIYSQVDDLTNSITSEMQAALTYDRDALSAKKDQLKALKGQMAAAVRSGALTSVQLANQQDQIAALQDMVDKAELYQEVMGPENAEKIRDTITDAGSAVEKMTGGLIKSKAVEEKLIAGIQKLGPGFAAALGPIMTIITAVSKIFSMMGEINAQTRDFGSQTGASFQQSEKLVKSSMLMSGSMGNIMSTQKEILAVQGAVVQEFGNMSAVSQDTVMALSNMSKVLGINEKDAAGVQQVLMQNAGASEDMALGVQQAGANLAEAAGVPIGEVMKDLAESGEEVAKYFAGMPKEAMKTAVQLKAMGLNMKTAAKMADGLLDIETSLKAESKAQIMLGKAINLDNARQLAAQGKIADAAAAATKEIGDAASFAKMDQFQKKAAAEAAGLTVEELSKSYAMQERIKNMSDEQKAQVEKYGDALGDVSKLDEQQLKDKVTALQEQEKMSAAMDNMKTAITTGLLPVMQILSPIFSGIAFTIKAILAPVTVIVGLFLKLGDYVNTLIEKFSFMKTLFDQVKYLAIGIGTVLMIAWLPTIYSFIAGLVSSIASMVTLAFSGIAAAIGPIFTTFSFIPFGLGIPLAIAAVYGLGALVNSFMDDGVVPPAGQGGPGYSRVLSGPEGSIAFNDKDTIVAGTDLAGGDGGAASSGGGMDIGPLVAAIQQTNALLSQMASSPPPVLIGDEALRKIGRNVKVQNSRGS
jgi:hypothetical protein